MSLLVLTILGLATLLIPFFVSVDCDGDFLEGEAHVRIKLNGITIFNRQVEFDRAANRAIIKAKSKKKKDRHIDLKSFSQKKKFLFVLAKSILGCLHIKHLKGRATIGVSESAFATSIVSTVVSSSFYGLSAILKEKYATEFSTEFDTVYGNDSANVGANCIIMFTFADIIHGGIIGVSQYMKSKRGKNND